MKFGIALLLIVLSATMVVGQNGQPLKPLEPGLVSKAESAPTVLSVHLRKSIFPTWS